MESFSDIQPALTLALKNVQRYLKVACQRAKERKSDTRTPPKSGGKENL